MDDLTLVELDETMEREFRAYVAESVASGESRIPGLLTNTACDFSTIVLRLKEQSTGTNIPKGWVPATTFWLASPSGRLLAISNLRHALTDGLLLFGGHIGYHVRPSERRKGYATRLLALMLDKARAIGLTRVLLTCDKDNVASARVIQKNGGVLEDERLMPDTGKLKQRYWIEIGKSARA